MLEDKIWTINAKTVNRACFTVQTPTTQERGEITDNIVDAGQDACNDHRKRESGGDE